VPGLAPTIVRTRAIADPGALSDRLPEEPVLSWIRDGEGIVGWGTTARLDLPGTEFAITAESWWREHCQSLLVDDAVRLPGTGPVAFGSLAFDARTATSTLVVPRVVLGRHAGRAWLTTFDEAPAAIPPISRPHAPHRVSYADGALTATEWTGAVAEAVRRIRAGKLDKVVLARDLLATTLLPIDVRFLIARLAEHYASCFTFSVDGMVGATPELLVRRMGDRIESRVLAGSARRGPGGDDLLRSDKERSEHEYAVRSVVDVLAKYCDPLDVPAVPSLLRLPNVVHLATDVSGTASSDATSLALAAAVHPPAAVCGTPTDVALDLIPELERMDRGRYAGPVGWVDAAGDGEWGIALRCAEVSDTRVRMFAGCGIVADSDPVRELAETQDKFVVIRDALEAHTVAVPTH
jgi:menaquinone-specific isochorismate synthase